MLVVALKNHYSSRSKQATEVATLFYAFFETARLRQADPRADVTRAGTRAIRDPGAVTLPTDLT